MGDWYYLVFSSYADRYQTLYRKSRSLNGPWETPEIDTFDTRAFYAAKTGCVHIAFQNCENELYWHCDEMLMFLYVLKQNALKRILKRFKPMQQIVAMQ